MLYHSNKDESGRPGYCSIYQTIHRAPSYTNLPIFSPSPLHSSPHSLPFALSVCARSPSHTLHRKERERKQQLLLLLPFWTVPVHEVKRERENSLRIHKAVLKNSYKRVLIAVWSYCFVFQLRLHLQPLLQSHLFFNQDVLWIPSLSQ